MNQNETKPLTAEETYDQMQREMSPHVKRELQLSKKGVIDVMERYAAQQVKQVTEERDKAVELLDESRVQLQYLDKRFPTGTTPNVVSMIETFLNSLNAAGSDTGNK